MRKKILTVTFVLGLLLIPATIAMAHEGMLPTMQTTGDCEEGEAPTVNLISSPFPPLLDLQSGETLVVFTAEVDGDPTAYTYSWDLDGDGIADEVSDEAAPNVASFEYESVGKIIASVTVEDHCGMTASDTMPVVVEEGEDEEEDPEGEEDDKGCHPTAQRIADAVTLLFVEDQAQSWYTCEDIFDIFTGGESGSHVGFGRLKKAVKLVDTIEDLTWEEIRDWKLDGAGWGALVQLDRFADALKEIDESYGIRDLLERMENEDLALKDIRSALRNVVHYGADFDDALARLTDGASPGELGQLYRAADQLGVDPEVIDEYLANGISLSDVRHAAKSAEQLGADWQEVLDAHAAGHGWGEIKQAYSLADDEFTAEQILAMGMKEYRKKKREKARADAQEEQNLRTASQIANKFSIGEAEVWEVFEGSCAGDWGCVRKHFAGSKGKGPKKDR
ncbi:MAG: hypothetical protein GTO14_23560 [Anaerolineales bacterium]|nr:hypothetical protein [Anaerolineales bacterium]